MITNNEQCGKTLEHSVQKGILSSNLSPQVSGNYGDDEGERVIEPEEMDGSRDIVPSRHNMNDLYIDILTKIEAAIMAPK